MEYSEKYDDNFNNYKFKVMIEFEMLSPSDRIAFKSMKRDLSTHLGHFIGGGLLSFRVLSIIKNNAADILIRGTGDILADQPCNKCGCPRSKHLNGGTCSTVNMGTLCGCHYFEPVPIHDPEGF